MHFAAISTGQKLYKRLCKTQTPIYHKLVNSIVVMFSRCGRLDDARVVFDQIPLKQRSLIQWTSIIMAYAEHGNGIQAIDLFKQMQGSGIVPDETCITCALNACSHSGLVDEALSLYNSMEDRYGIKPNIIHTTCMVDTLARKGYIEQAESILQTLPQTNAVVAWTALLGACRSYSNLETAEQVFNIITELESENAASYVLMANIYSHANNRSEANSIR
jgi:pentatricopeptide repeat protein